MLRNLDGGDPLRGVYLIAAGAAAFAMAMMGAADPAAADCAPPTFFPGVGTGPLMNATVTCSGTVHNQNTFPSAASYGTGFENGLTINVVSGSVTGDNFGISVQDANTITNAGSIGGGCGHTGRRQQCDNH